MNNNLDIKNIKTAKRYALALAQSSIDNIDEISSDMELINNSVFKNDEFRTFFLHPVVALKDKKETVETTLRGKINDITLNFIQTLLDENRFVIFSTIYELFKDEVDKIKNAKRVEITSAIELDDNTKERIVQKLSQKLNKKIIPDYYTDNSIIAGIVIKLDDNIIDLSLSAKFNELKNLTRI